MSIISLIDQDLKKAMRDRNKLQLSVIRMVKSDILLAIKEKKEDLTDDEAIDIICKHIKLRNDSIREFKKANRLDLVDTNEKEIEILNKYLPPQLSIQEIYEIIDEEISNTNTNNLGDIMKKVVPRVKGKADLNQVNKIIREKLDKTS